MLHSEQKAALVNLISTESDVLKFQKLAYSYDKRTTFKDLDDSDWVSFSSAYRRAISPTSNPNLKPEINPNILLTISVIQSVLLLDVIDTLIANYQHLQRQNYGGSRSF